MPALLCELCGIFASFGILGLHEIYHNKTVRACCVDKVVTFSFRPGDDLSNHHKLHDPDFGGIDGRIGEIGDPLVEGAGVHEFAATEVTGLFIDAAAEAFAGERLELVDVAEGELVAWINSDDMYAPGSLHSAALKWLESKNARNLYTNNNDIF